MVTPTAIAVSEIREEKAVRYMVESLKECLIDALFNAGEELACVRSSLCHILSGISNSECESCPLQPDGCWALRALFWLPLEDIRQRYERLKERYGFEMSV